MHFNTDCNSGFPNESHKVQDILCQELHVRYVSYCQKGGMGELPINEQKNLKTAYSSEWFYPT